MIDYELFKSILSNKNIGYIEDGDFIDNKLLDLLVESHQDKVKSLFVTYQNRIALHYKVEKKCTKCGVLEIEEMSKTGLMELIKSIKRDCHPLCSKCYEEELIAKKEKEKILKDDMKRHIEEETSNYISTYLNPNAKWNNGAKNYIKLRELNRIYCLNGNEIIDYIKSMDYYDFLETPYWKAISEKVRIKADYKCQLCGNTYNLNVHHRTYEHHGEELQNMNDLICLCNECHSKFHDK